MKSKSQRAASKGKRKKRRSEDKPASPGVLRQRLARLGWLPPVMFLVLPAVIVTAATSPTWNMVLAAASGLVVEEGGLTGHAAIVSRELGLPALIGAKGATRLIPNGAEVELDTVTGEARVLSGG